MPFLHLFVIFISRMVANALDVTFSKGDAIAIDMQMTVNAVIIYLAIILAGMVVVSIADSFAPKEIATRLRVSKAKGIFTQVLLTIYIYIYKSFGLKLESQNHNGLSSYLKRIIMFVVVVVVIVFFLQDFISRGGRKFPLYR